MTGVEEIEVLSNRVYNSLAKHSLRDVIGALKQYAVDQGEIPEKFVKAVLLHGSKRIQHLGAHHDMLDLEMIPLNDDYSMLEDDTEHVSDDMHESDVLRAENVMKFWRSHITGHHDADDKKH